MTSRSVIKAFLQLTPPGTQSRGYEMYLKYGREFFNLDKAQSLATRKLYKCKNKECYANCQRIVTTLRAPGLTYYEGMALGFAGLPIDHAWLVNDAGEVIDPTWVQPRRSLAFGDYFGVAIPVEFIREQMLATEYYQECLPAYLWQLWKKENKND